MRIFELFFKKLRVGEKKIYVFSQQLGMDKCPSSIFVLLDLLWTSFTVGLCGLNQQLEMKWTARGKLI